MLCQTDAQRKELLAVGGIPIGIGRSSVIKRAIIDKNARIGENVKVGGFICTAVLALLRSLCPWGMHLFVMCQWPIWIAGVQIVNKDDVQEAARETDGYFIKGGIVTIIKDAVIPSNTII